MRNCKITMNLGHGGSPFADGAAHALYRAGAHVADREYTRDARLERGNGVSGNSLGYHLPGQHEAIRVDRRAATSEPFSFRVRTNEQEDVMYRPLFLGTAGAIAPRHGFESSLRVTVQLGQFGIEVQFDVGSRLDTLDQVARHARREAGAAYQHRYLGRVLPQVYGCLPGRVAAPDQSHFFAGARLRFERGCPIPHTAALEFGEARQRGPAIARAAG